MSSERAMRASGWVPYAELAELEAQLQQANETIERLEAELLVARAGSVFTDVLDAMDGAAEDDPAFMDRLNEDNDRMIAEGQSKYDQALATVAQQAATISELTEERDALKKNRDTYAPKVIAEINEQRREIERQSATIGELHKLLERSEWIPVFGGGTSIWHFCNECSANRSMGHHKDCELAAVLAKLPKERPGNTVPAQDDTQSRGIPFRRS